MTAATMTPPAAKTASKPSAPTYQPYRWTIAEYRELGKTGLFHDMKTMLIDGEIYAMVMPAPPHDTALNLAQDILRRIFSTGHHVRNQQGFDIGTRNDPGPDLAVVPGTVRDYETRTPTTATIVVEVSDTTLQTDLTVKAELYATANVPEYWVIDLSNRQLVVFRDPKPLPKGLGATAYRTHFTVAENDSVAPLAAPNTPVTVADLLPR